MLNNLSKCQAIFQSDWIIYISTSSEWVFHFFPCPCQQVLFSDFLIESMLVGVKWYLLVILICIFLMTNSFEHLFMCFLIICIFSWEKCLYIFFTHFWIGLLSFYYWVPHMFYIQVPFKYVICKYIFPFWEWYLFLMWGSPSLFYIYHSSCFILKLLYLLILCLLTALINNLFLVMSLMAPFTS